MQITRAGEYGVLGLINLAQRAPGELVMIEEISRLENVPKSFLAKIFQSLARAGIIRSIRGAHGGFALLKQPSQITALEIFEAIEGKIMFQRCQMESPRCGHTGGCALCGLFEEAQDGLKEILASTTLEDLLRRHEASQTGQAVPKRTSRKAAKADVLN
jgi:Rrf2 family protein